MRPRLQQDRRAFSVVELMVVTLLVGLILGFLMRSMYGSRQSADRTRRVDVSRLVRQIHDRLEHDVRNLTALNAPTFHKVSLAMEFHDTRNRKVLYENRDENGKMLSTPDQAKQARSVFLVRIEENAGKMQEKTIVSSPLLQYVLFRRLGRTLLGVDVILDPEELDVKKAEDARYRLLFSLSRCF